jgi:predicted RNA-binding protein with RPS1 domain
MLVMTDQERREEGAEGELLNELLGAAETPVTRPAATTASESEVAAPAQAADEAGDVPAQEAAGDEPTEQGVQAVTGETGDTTATMDGDAGTEPTATMDGDAGTEPTAMVSADATEARTADPATEVASAAAMDAGEGASFTPAEDDNDSGRPRRLKDLESGMELEGKVTSIALYGIFVDIGVGRDGLVHISEMSDSRIDSPSDMVQINDVVQVRIKSIDPDARRISLTMRSQAGARRGKPKRAEVDRDALGTLKPGDTIEGTITGLAPFGAFADIGVGKDGLIHISELAEGRVDKPEDAVRVGEVYTFKVIEVDPDGTRISLSLRRALRSQKMQQLEPGQILDGTVSGLAPFGAFVDIGVGRDGLVHISALSEARVARVEDVVQVGDKVQVRVLEVDSQSKRISLTMRLTEPDPSEETEEQAETELRSVGSNYNRFNEVRENQSRREESRRRSRDRRSETAPSTPETYTVGDDDEEEFEGNATLEDLLSKFGSPGVRRDRDRRRDDDEDEEEDEDRRSRKQRDAIRRTLQQVGSDE